MFQPTDSTPNPILRRTALAALLLFLAWAAYELSMASPRLFTPFFGSIHPFWPVLITILGISGSLRALRKSGVFFTYRRATATVWIGHIAVITLLAGISILLDLTLYYPKDMHVLLPESLLFYPLMGAVAEFVFHLLPISLIAWWLKLRGGDALWNNWTWVLAVIAMLEPSFQIYYHPYAIGYSVILWLNLYVFNLLQLQLFRNYGFWALFGSRMWYYLIWHLLWGTLRQDLLFL